MTTNDPLQVGHWKLHKVVMRHKCKGYQNQGNRTITIIRHLFMLPTTFKIFPEIIFSNLLFTFWQITLGVATETQLSLNCTGGLAEILFYMVLLTQPHFYRGWGLAQADQHLGLLWFQCWAVAKRTLPKDPHWMALIKPAGNRTLVFPCARLNQPRYPTTRDSSRCYI